MHPTLAFCGLKHEWLRCGGGRGRRRGCGAGDRGDRVTRCAANDGRERPQWWKERTRPPGRGPGGPRQERRGRGRGNATIDAASPQARAAASADGSARQNRSILRAGETPSACLALDQLPGQENHGRHVLYRRLAQGLLRRPISHSLLESKLLWLRRNLLSLESEQLCRASPERMGSRTLNYPVHMRSE